MHWKVLILYHCKCIWRCLITREMMKFTSHPVTIQENRITMYANYLGKKLAVSRRALDMGGYCTWWKCVTVQLHVREELLCLGISVHERNLHGREIHWGGKWNRNDPLWELWGVPNKSGEISFILEIVPTRLSVAITMFSLAVDSAMEHCAESQCPMNISPILTHLLGRCLSVLLTTLPLLEYTLLIYPTSSPYTIILHQC